MKSILSEYQAIISMYPEISFLEMLAIARQRGWNHEPLSPDQEAVIAQLPAWQALQHINSYTLFTNKRESQQSPQFIDTGLTCVIEHLLSDETVQRLAFLYQSQVSKQANKPLCLINFLEEQDSRFENLIINVAKDVMSVLNLRGFCNKEWVESEPLVILMNRCLIRRTYSLTSGGLVSRNGNNQAWHQDSNILFQDKPLITIWIPLQEHSGIRIPGIEVANIRLNHFSPVYGDGVDSLGELLCEYQLDPYTTTTPIVRAGGAVVFNGLSFHRTYTNSKMAGHRDAFLIRVCPLSHSQSFPGERSKDLIFTI